MRWFGETLEWWAVAGRLMRRMARLDAPVALRPPVAVLVDADGAEAWRGPALLVGAMARSGLLARAGEADVGTLYALTALGRAALAAGTAAERSMRAEIARLRDVVDTLRAAEDRAALDEPDPEPDARQAGEALLDGFTPTQRALLRPMVVRPDKNVTVEALVAASGLDMTESSLRQHICHIRQRWARLGLPGAIETAGGVGYCFQPNAKERRRTLPLLPRLRTILSERRGRWIEVGDLLPLLYGGAEPPTARKCVSAAATRLEQVLREEGAAERLERKPGSLRIAAIDGRTGTA